MAPVFDPVALFRHFATLPRLSGEGRQAGIETRIASGRPPAKSAAITPSSGSAIIERRMAGIYMGGKAAAQDPQLVAEMIERAITTDAPKLRYRVGVDAEVFATKRPLMSDEVYIEGFGRKQTDDEFFAEFVRRFPMPTA